MSKTFCVRCLQEMVCEEIRPVVGKEVMAGVFEVSEGKVMRCKQCEAEALIISDPLLMEEKLIESLAAVFGRLDLHDFSS